MARGLAVSPQSASAKLCRLDPMKQPTPKTLGYRMPAEWEPQQAVWLAWPHNELTWPGGMLADVEGSYIEIIRALHTGQKIKLLVKNSDSEARIRGSATTVRHSSRTQNRGSLRW